MNENTRQVLERREAARRELELQLLALFINFEARWGATVESVDLDRVDLTKIKDPAPRWALVHVEVKTTDKGAI